MYIQTGRPCELVGKYCTTLEVDVKTEPAATAAAIDADIWDGGGGGATFWLLFVKFSCCCCCEDCTDAGCWD